jgi:hypothetical protein
LKEEGRRKKEEGRGRRKKEEGRRKKEEGRRKKEEGRKKIVLFFLLSFSHNKFRKKDSCCL